MMYTEVASLPFRKIYAIDFEYCGADGEIPNIVCMVIEDLRSGEVSRYWCDDLCEMRTPPFETGEDVALLGYLCTCRGAEHARSGLGCRRVGH